MHTTTYHPYNTNSRHTSTPAESIYMKGSHLASVKMMFRRDMPSMNSSYSMV